MIILASEMSSWCVLMISTIMTIKRTATSLLSRMHLLQAPSQAQGAWSQR